MIATVVQAAAVTLLRCLISLGLLEHTCLLDVGTLREFKSACSSSMYVGIAKLKQRNEDQDTWFVSVAAAFLQLQI